MTDHVDDQLVTFRQAAQIKLNFRTRELYEPVIRATKDLVGRYSNEGIASVAKFLRKTEDLVVEQFQTLEAIIREIYIDPFKADPFPKPTEVWLRQVLKEAIDSETVRAQKLMQKLCSSFVGATPNRYEVFLGNLQDLGLKTYQNLEDAVTLLTLERNACQPTSALVANSVKKIASTTQMLDELITEGRLLHLRIVKHYESGSESLPPEERITVPELQAWYDGVTRVLGKQFGVESDECHLWHEA